VVINHRGEILAIRLTPGNVDDRKPVAGLCQSLFGKLFGDKGYLAKWLSDIGYRILAIGYAGRAECAPHQQSAKEYEAD
jgi:hypothetical protein